MILNIFFGLDLYSNRRSCTTDNGRCYGSDDLDRDLSEVCNCIAFLVNFISGPQTGYSSSSSSKKAVFVAILVSALGVDFPQMFTFFCIF